MITYADLIALEKIEYSDVKLLWHADYYDGPINGLCSWNGKEYWFDMFDNIQRSDKDKDFGLHVNLYALIELDSNALAWEHERHKAFEEHVGTHTSYTNPDGTRPIGATRPKSEHDKYYKDPRWQEKRDYSHYPVVGYFNW